MVYEECPICRNANAGKRGNSNFKPSQNQGDHMGSIEHRFNFFVWAYKDYRKALMKDRHGIQVTASPENIKGTSFDYNKNKGKYFVKVSESRARSNQDVIFNCKIQNTRKDSVHVTSINLLHPSDVFQIIHRYNFGSSPEYILKLDPGATYEFQVTFSVKHLPGSYKIPLTCDIQTIDEQFCFTICRTFLVSDPVADSSDHVKSPFTNQVWKPGVELTPPKTGRTYANNYAIPVKYMRILKMGLKAFNNMTSLDSDMLLDVRKKLKGSIAVTEDNYRDLWHFALWLEEIAQTVMIRGYNMENVNIKVNRSTLILEVPGLAEKRPSVIAGDTVHIRVHDDHKGFIGNVRRVFEKTIEIEDVDDELVEYIKGEPDIELDVAFVMNRLTFERMHEGVDKVVANGLVSYLFPKNIFPSSEQQLYQLNDKDFFNETVSINEEQKQAVVNILNSSSQKWPYLVYGPPGTGKTITIVEAILQIKTLTKKKILVCAPANSACDMIALKLIPHCTKQELIRIHSDSRETLTLTDELMNYSNIAEDGEGFKKLTSSEVACYRIVVTTLTLIGRYREKYHPHCVFIDEAAQASEPECDIALGVLGHQKQIVLAGDPKQLGPMVLSSCAKEYGFEISLLERLMRFNIYQQDQQGNFNQNFITMLKLNFRSHPDILSIPNRRFYGGNLEAVSQKAQDDPIAKIAIYPRIFQANQKHPRGRAIEFCSVSSKEKTEGASPSYFNNKEVNVVVQYVKTIINLPLKKDKVVQEDIGVVTPYKRQLYKIKEKLEENKLKQVEVGTTESFQGREKRIIVISTVRAQHSLLLHDRKYNLGFVRHDQRFNVAITRPTSKLIVVGCQPVLITDEKWQEFIDECREYGTYFGAPYIERDATFKTEVVRRMNGFKQVDDQNAQRK